VGLKLKGGGGLEFVVKALTTNMYVYGQVPIVAWLSHNAPNEKRILPDVLADTNMEIIQPFLHNN